MNDFINEMYLSMSFATSINYSDFRFTSAAVTFNNIFAMVVTAVLCVNPVYISVQVYRKWKRDDKIGAANLILKEGGEEEDSDGSAHAPRRDYDPEKFEKERRDLFLKCKAMRDKRVALMKKNTGLAPRAGLQNPGEARKVLQEESATKS